MPRLFVAIDPGVAVRDAVFSATRSLRDAAPDVSWVSPEKLHLTMRFLGETDEARVPELLGAMGDVAHSHRGMTLALGGVGAFPNFRRARVVWMGVAPEPRLELLHHDLETAMVGCGYEVEGRAFRPHLTLGRVRERMDEATLKALGRAGKAMSFSAEALVGSLELMESRAGRYVMLGSATLSLTG
ncbi:MAG: hypothetical protein JWO05_1105 [Gemmatimonadetes bacterium]|nr:hypothetical protein [Gemmatimonadota bacterium]